MTSRTLTAVEVRVLGVLVEKQHTVPDSYPLSLNALTLGCNQKTAREPVMNLSEAEVLQAINGLKELSLVTEVSGSRVTRFEHNASRGLGIPSQSVALLTMLVLRGPQTSAELRLHTERLHRFVDISSVDGFLDEMAEREPHRVIKLPKAPGEREARWAHLLCGEPVLPVATPVRADDDLHAEMATLKAEVADLKTLVHRLARELGIETSNEDLT